jgi:hypothetical protein
MELELIHNEALRVGARCLHLYWWGRSESQWATQYASVTGEWEWWFWL